MGIITSDWRFVAARCLNLWLPSNFPSARWPVGAAAASARAHHHLRVNLASQFGLALVCSFSPAQLSMLLSKSTPEGKCTASKAGHATQSTLLEAKPAGKCYKLDLQVT